MLGRSRILLGFAKILLGGSEIVEKTIHPNFRGFPRPSATLFCENARLTFGNGKIQKDIQFSIFAGRDKQATLGVGAGSGVALNAPSLDSPGICSVKMAFNSKHAMPNKIHI